jgi:hypothetical protein
VFVQRARVGLVAYDLAGNDDVAQRGFFNTLGCRRQLEVAIDHLAERFGIDVVKRADDLNKPTGVRFSPTLDYLDQNSAGRVWFGLHDGTCAASAG